jgi:hypothetical protein
MLVSVDRTTFHIPTITTFTFDMSRVEYNLIELPFILPPLPLTYPGSIFEVDI